MVTLQQASKLAGIGRRAILRYIENGRILRDKDGYIDRYSLDTFIADRKIPEKTVIYVERPVKKSKPKDAPMTNRYFTQSTTNIPPAPIPMTEAGIMVHKKDNGDDYSAQIFLGSTLRRARKASS